MEIEVELEGWYWLGNELRECVVARMAGVLMVIDSVTGEDVSVEPQDVMIVRPE